MLGKRKYGSFSSHEERTIELSSVKRSSQACDRCRLKKIKCDGVRPSCTSCKKIGYQCRTSDKLTRRGFPRGYTEMLEQEVIKLQRLYNSVRGSSGGAVQAVQAARPRDDGGGSTRADADTGAADTDAGFGHGCEDKAGNIGAVVDADPRQPPQHTQPLLPLPFVNDSFYYYTNYADGETYLGNAVWPTIVGGCRDKSVIPSDDGSLVQSLERTFQLDSTGVPAALARLYHNDISLARANIKSRVSAFLKEFSLIPLLYGNDWKARLKSIVSVGAGRRAGAGGGVGGRQHGGEDPTAMLAVVYIIQWNYSLFSPETLFNMTKLVCTLAGDMLSGMQVLLLGSYYFMSLPRQLTTRQSGSVGWTMQLMNLAFSQVLSQGLYVNYKKLVPVGGDGKGGDRKACGGGADEGAVVGEEGDEGVYETRLVAFWVFQFLSSLWSLLQGLPKTNFLSDEFQPPGIASLEVAALRPFQILLENMLQLDGCNLLQVLGMQNARYTYVVESFRHTLNHWKLYHNFRDHDLNEITVDNNDRIEIQLTLCYLLPRWLTEQGFPESHHLSSEILSLYYLLLANEQGSSATVTQPSVLKLIHFMPWDNWELIKRCFQNLSKVARDVDKYTFEKYRDLITNWSHLWYEDDPTYEEVMDRYNIKVGDRFGRPVTLVQIIQNVRNGVVAQVASANRPLLKPFRSPSTLSAGDPFNMFSNNTPVAENSPSQWFLMSAGLDLVSSDPTAVSAASAETATAMGSVGTLPNAIGACSFSTATAAMGNNATANYEPFPCLAEDDDGYVEDDESEEGDDRDDVLNFSSGPNHHTLFSHRVNARKLTGNNHVILENKHLMRSRNKSESETCDPNASTPIKDSGVPQLHYELVPDSLTTDVNGCRSHHTHNQHHILGGVEIGGKNNNNSSNSNGMQTGTATPRSLVDLLILPMAVGKKGSGDGITTPKDEDSVLRSNA
ncbi:Sip4p Ecym_6340 [Eremothecium cymbalariae DBVPG|uniref:Zn(2)-C6 fungal-type domain-containing protein n=1 Tax=Eremothecium cymbalariae (strain CBS 270.75 / DBVPG 7215 / KCTC 17166 / NRRL Y-17582) TaxID=931890 RepID=G8JUD6_ERECY|nr:hypothetical protein Ecym_6340 [Eremothecium cymbalariae DBVPG\